MSDDIVAKLTHQFKMSLVLSHHNSITNSSMTNDQVLTSTCNSTAEWHEYHSSPGIHIEVGLGDHIDPRRTNVTFGQLRFSPLAEKVQNKTGPFMIYFNVVSGTFMFRLDSESKTEEARLVKTGGHFEIGQYTQYSITNLRQESSLLDFAIIFHHQSKAKAGHQLV